MTEEDLLASYRENFSRRGEATPSAPLEYHLHHLARYWSRLSGFSRLTPGPHDSLADGGLGMAIGIGNRFADELIDSNSPVHASWATYMELATMVLRSRPLALADIESASAAFDQCLSRVGYNPWTDPPIAPR